MVTQTTLHFERTGVGAGGSHAGFPQPGPKGGMLGRRAGDAAQDVPSNAKLTMGYDDIAQLAKDRARSDDPQLRQELARLYTDTRTGLWHAQRSEEHTYELQSLLLISYAVLCLKKKKLIS